MSTDMDVVSNKSNVSQARAEKLLKSWSTPFTEKADLWEADDDDDDGFEEEEGAEKFGVGTVAPPSGDDAGLDLSRKPNTTKDQLLEYMIGKQAAKQHRAKLTASVKTKGLVEQDPTATVSPSADAVPAAVEQEDDEAGRATLIRTKNERKRKSGASSKIGRNATADNDSDASEPDPSGSRRGAGKSKGTSYLDQILAEKAGKRKKRKV